MVSGPIDFRTALTFMNKNGTKGSRVELNLAACSLYKKEAFPQRPHCGRGSFSRQVFQSPRYTACVMRWG